MSEPYTPGRHAASPVLGAARARTGSSAGASARFPRHRPPLSPERRGEIAAAMTEGSYCTLCGGIHAGLSLPACPRVASAELDADGKIRAVVMWQDGEWDASGVYFAADAEEDSTGD